MILKDHDSTGSENDGLDMDDVRRYFDRNERHNSFAKTLSKIIIKITTNIEQSNDTSQ